MENDDLGRVGELFFDSLCTKAGLTCNSSNRDKVGWDFVVDFPHEHSAQTFDHRPGPVSCVVQVKSVNNGARRVKVRLDMAERLAKEIKPSFFVCPVFEGDEPIRVYVIHVRGKALEVILKRLRQAQANKTPQKLSNKSVSFPLVERERLSGLEPSVIRKMFSKACPDGMDVYAVDKANERKSLGYDDTAYAGEFSVELSSPDELMDFFFGRRRELPVEMGDILETRFGITLPHVSGGPGLLSIDPAPTHNVYFHKEVTFAKGAGGLPKSAFWVCRKKGEVSNLVAYKNNNPVKSSYQLLWQDVRKPQGHSLTLPNTMRRIFDSYFKLLGGLDIDKACGNLVGDEKIAAHSLLSWANDGSHAVHEDLYMVPNEDQDVMYLKVFRRIFDNLQQGDHYRMMMDTDFEPEVEDAAEAA